MADYHRQAVKGYEKFESSLRNENETKSISILNYLLPPTSTEIEGGRGVFLNGGNSAMSRFVLTVIDKTQEKLMIGKANLPVTLLDVMQGKLDAKKTWIETNQAKNEVLYESGWKHFSNERWGNRYVAYNVTMRYENGDIVTSLKKGLCPVNTVGKKTFPVVNDMTNPQKTEIRFPFWDFYGMWRGMVRELDAFCTTHYRENEELAATLDLAQAG